MMIVIVNIQNYIYILIIQSINKKIMSKKSSHNNNLSEFQTPKTYLQKTNHHNNVVSEFKISEFSENKLYDNNNQKNKITRLIKKIAELELRETKYIQKIKYLQTMNIRISRENFDQSQTKNQSADIQNILKVYQQELKKLNPIKERSLEQDSNTSNKDLNLSKHIQQISKQRENWIKRYQQLIQKSNKSLEQQTHKRLEFQYENKYLKQKLHDLEIKFEKLEKLEKLEKATKEKPEKHNNNNEYQINKDKDNREKYSSSNKIAILEKQNNELKRANLELESQFVKLEKQISEKFNFLEEQISLYETEKSENLEKIQALKAQLATRQSVPFFSFSNNQNTTDTFMQTEEVEYQMDLSCFKSSIQSLLQQNNRLKKSLSLLQNFVIQNNNQLPKQLQIQFQLNKSIKK